MTEPRPRRMSVGEWVLAVRQAMGISSQEAFAERLGRGRSAVAKWETGLQTPNLASFRKLWMMATPILRQSAPQAIESLGISDLAPHTPGDDQTGYTTKTKEATAVAEELDAIEDSALRKRARNAALTAIEAVQHPRGGNNGSNGPQQQ